MINDGNLFWLEKHITFLNIKINLGIVCSKTIKEKNTMRIMFLTFLGLCGFVVPLFSQSNTIDISFDEIKEFINTHSPIIKLIEQAYDLKESERRLNLTWTNPSIDYSQEVIRNKGFDDKEHFLVLSKQFEMPWLHFARRKSWHYFMESANYQKKDNYNNFVSNIKSGYIEIKLIEEQINRLKRFNQVIDDIAKIAQHQMEEGAISGINHQLIQMTQFNIDAKLIELAKSKHSIENLWKAKIGIDESDDINLSTTIDFKSIAIKSSDYYQALAPATFGIVQRERMKTALQKQIRVQKQSWLPNLTLFGGYKKVEPDFNGYTFGLSLPVPILNINRHQIKKSQVEMGLFENELLLYRLELKSKIDSRLKIINNYLNSLQKNSSRFKTIEQVVENITFSYQQRSVSLTDVLTYAQIYSEGIQNYYVQLTDYYRSIFELEALIGEKLITF
jgi:hypothetical protein